MEEKSEKVLTRTCPYCGEKVENPNINYCTKCGNVLWTPSFRKRPYIRVGVV